MPYSQPILIVRTSSTYRSSSSWFKSMSSATVTIFFSVLLYFLLSRVTLNVKQWTLPCILCNLQLCSTHPHFLWQFCQLDVCDTSHSTLMGSRYLLPHSWFFRCKPSFFPFHAFPWFFQLMFELVLQQLDLSLLHQWMNFDPFSRSLLL